MTKYPIPLTEPSRCLIALHASGEIVCRGTIENQAEEIISETVCTLTPESPELFHGTDYDTLREFLLTQPQNCAIAHVSDGHIQLATDGE